MTPRLITLAALLCFIAAVNGTVFRPAHTYTKRDKESHNGSDDPPALVTVQLLPRSQWDTQKTYEAARIVATRPVRICQELDQNGADCIREVDAWTTAVCRDHPWQGYAQENSRSHTLAQPHMFELYRTFDNLTYTEIPLTNVPNILHNHPDAFKRDQQQQQRDGVQSDEEGRVQRLERIQQERDYGLGDPLEPEDFELLELARILAYGTKKKLVFRWDMGRLWPIPVEQWNAGERALHTGAPMTVHFLDVDISLMDDRPLYIPVELEGDKK